MIISELVELDKKTRFRLSGSGGILVTGRSGSGKTNVTTHIMLSAMAHAGAGIYIIDAKRADMFNLREYLNHGANRVVADSNQVARLMRELTTNLNHRYERMTGGNWGADYHDYGLRPYLLVIDEVSAMMAEAGKNKSEIMGYLRQLILKGRQAGIFTLISSQRLSADTLDRDITLQMGTRIIMGQADNDSYRMAFPMIESVTDLPTIPREPGYGLIYYDGQSSSNPTPFVAPDMTNINVPAIVKDRSELLTDIYQDEHDYWIG